MTEPDEATEVAISGVVAERFTDFFHREFVKMVALAEAVSGDPSAAEDIAAEAMSRANDRWDAVSQYDRPGAWLRRVTINLATSRRRRLGVERRHLRQKRAIDLTEPPADVDHPVWAEVARLPAKQRGAVALFYIEDLPVAEIAEVLDCSVSTATTHLSRARQRLAERLSEGGAL